MGIPRNSQNGDEMRFMINDGDLKDWKENSTIKLEMIFSLFPRDVNLPLGLFGYAHIDNYSLYEI